MKETDKGIICINGAVGARRPEGGMIPPKIFADQLTLFKSEGEGGILCIPHY